MNSVGISPSPTSSTNDPPPAIKDSTSPKTSQPQEEEEITPAERSLLQKVMRTGLIKIKSDIEVMRKDPSSPLYSVKTFEALNL